MSKGLTVTELQDICKAISKKNEDGSEISAEQIKAWPSVIAQNQAIEPLYFSPWQVHTQGIRGLIQASIGDDTECRIPRDTPVWRGMGGAYVIANQDDLHQGHEEFVEAGTVAEYL